MQKDTFSTVELSVDHAIMQEHFNNDIFNNNKRAL